jgi:hypothetical protein
MDYAAPSETNPLRVWIINTSGQTAVATTAVITIPEGASVWAGDFRPRGTPDRGTLVGGDTVTISLGDIPSGGVRAITAPIALRDDAPVGNSLDWLVDTNYSEPSSSTSTIVQPNHLQVAITADKQALAPGDEFLVTMHIVNPANTGVSRAELTGQLPDSLELLFSNLPEGSFDGDSFSVALGTIPGNSLHQYVMKLKLDAGAAVPALFPVSASVGGRIDEEFGGATLQLLGLVEVPARTTVIADFPYQMTTHNFAGSRLENGRLYSHVPKNGSLWAGDARPIANSVDRGTITSREVPFRWDLPDVFSGDAHFIQLPLTSTGNSFARVQRNELVAGSVAIPSDAPFVRAGFRGGNLSLELKAPEPIGPGEEFIYEVRYGNPSDSNTDRASIILHLPESVSISNASAAYSDLGNRLYAVQLGEVRPGETGLFWMRLVASEISPESNQLDFSAWLQDESFPVKTAFDRLIVQWYDDFPLKMNLSSKKQMLQNDALFLADLEITNTDAFPLTDVQVTVSTPVGMNFWRGYAHPVPADGDRGTLYHMDPVTWLLPTLGAGETRVISMPWELDTLSGWWYTLNAVVTTTEGFNGRVQSLIAANGQSDTSLFLQLDNNSVAPGGEVWMTATLTNPGSDSSLNPSLSIILPEGVSFIESDVEPVQTSPVLRFNFSSMNPSDRGRVRVKVAVSDTFSPGDNPVIIAQVRDESIPANVAVADLPMVIEEDTPLEIQVTGHRDPSDGGTRQVEALLTNTSDEILEDLVIWLHVPDYLSLNPAQIQPFGGSFTNLYRGYKYRYSLETLSPEEPFLLSLPFDTRDDAKAGWISPLTVHVTSSEGYYARDSEHTAFFTGNLNIEIIPMDDFAKPGNSMSYRIYIGNKASEARQNVVLRTSIPEGATFESASGGGSLFASEVLWELGTIPAVAVAYVDLSVNVDGNLTAGTILTNEAYVSDSERPRNSARAVTSIPVGRSTPRLSLDVDYADGDLTWSLNNNTGQELASARFWYTMPGWLFLENNSNADARTPIIWDLLNVVSDEPQDLVSTLALSRNTPRGHVAPFTAAVRTNQGYGAVRRFVLPITDQLYAVDSDPLPPELRQMWTDAESFDGGWVRSTWYGWFLRDDWPWIIHAEHGYQYPIYNEFGLYLYDFSLGAWIFASQPLYFEDPNFALMYVFDDPDWLPMGFYRGGVAPDRWFYHYGPEFDRAMNESEFRPLLHPDEG